MFALWLFKVADNVLQLKEVGGFGTLNCLYAQCLLVEQLFVFALLPPFFLGAVIASAFDSFIIVF